MADPMIVRRCTGSPEVKCSSESGNVRYLLFSGGVTFWGGINEKYFAIGMGGRLGIGCISKADVEDGNQGFFSVRNISIAGPGKRLYLLRAAIQQHRPGDRKNDSLINFVGVHSQTKRRRKPGTLQRYISRSPGHGNPSTSILLKMAGSHGRRYVTSQF